MKPSEQLPDSDSGSRNRLSFIRVIAFPMLSQVESSADARVGVYEYEETVNEISGVDVGRAFQRDYASE